jgi:hypothetical protein
MSAAFLRAATVAAATVALGDAPAAQGRPLPAFDSFVAAVRQNLTRADRAEVFYAFKERRTDIHTNPFGKIGTDGTRVLDVYPSPVRQLTYRRLIERNGIPISSEELAEQDREYRARVTDVRRQLAAESASDRRSREERSRQRTRTRIDDVVDALQFRIDRREQYRGVDAIVVTFAPKPGARPTTREGRIAHRFAGSAWIDEAAAEVMQVEAGRWRGGSGCRQG